MTDAMLREAQRRHSRRQSTVNTELAHAYTGILNALRGSAAVRLLRSCYTSARTCVCLHAGALVLWDRKKRGCEVNRAS